jgi:Icc-related predicted phosphoesterase
MEVLRQDEAQATLVFRRLMLETVQRWFALADERLKDSGIRFFVIPGNDDDYCIDAALSGSDNVINLDGKVVRLDDWHEILSLGFSNPTPWRTPRELPESEFESRLGALAERVEDMKSCVFNIHAPPFNSGLDECAELDAELNIIFKAGHLVTSPAGSKAVRSVLEKHQPMVGLFGHIHEARGFTRIGRTLCVNPGSDYEEGILNGCLLSLEKGKIQHFQLTAG